MPVKQNSNEYQDIIGHAYLGASFATCVFDCLIEDPRYSIHRILWEQLRDVELAIRDQLASLHDSKMLGDSAHWAADYVGAIGKLGLSELLAATVTFGRASLYRLHRLSAIAPKTIAPIYVDLIVLESQLVTAVEAASGSRGTARVSI